MHARLLLVGPMLGYDTNVNRFSWTHEMFIWTHVLRRWVSATCVELHCPFFLSCKQHSSDQKEVTSAGVAEPQVWKHVWYGHVRVFLQYLLTTVYCFLIVVIGILMSSIIACARLPGLTCKPHSMQFSRSAVCPQPSVASCSCDARYCSSCGFLSCLVWP